MPENGAWAQEPSEVHRTLERALFELKRVIVGQEQMLERTLVALLAGGHLLIEGVPGLAKTLTVKSLAEVLGGTFHRVQFTPDLVPSDLVGTRVYRPTRESFDVEQGPVFCNFLLADEINRAPAKVQSALLEVMQERQVTIGTTTFPVPDPFLVLATQNPIESEGTYELPEAQVDRFMMKVVVHYPDHGEEMAIVARSLVRAPVLEQVLSVERLHELQQRTLDVYVDPRVTSYAASLVVTMRRPGRYGLEEIDPHVAFGASPRGSISLVHGARALALVRGRDYVLPQDVRELAPDVLRHRIVLSYEGLAAGVDPDALVRAVLETVPMPRIDLGEPAGTEAA